MRRASPQRGFTLIEMVVAIAISAVVLLFAGMFITAPVDAYEAQSRRARLLGDAATAWPRIQEDLRNALPNSVRETRNARYAVLEMLNTWGHAEYLAAPTINNFIVTGTTRGYFGEVQPGTGIDDVYLAVNNPGQQAYTRTVSMSPLLNIVSAAPTAVAGQANLTLSRAPAVTTTSPRNRVYLVRGFVAYLCDQTLGTLTRYEGRTVVTNVAARLNPAGYPGANAEVVGRGISVCTFQAPVVAGRPQEVRLWLTTRRNNDTVTMQHRATLENLP